jgi:type I restriction enzyme, S subunit
MVENWQTKKLGEVCDVIAGQSPEGQFYNSKGEGTPFYQGKKEFTEKYLGNPTVWTTNITKAAQVGDILMSVRAPVGPINFSTSNICIGRGLAAIRPSKLIDKEFLFYFLQKQESEIVGNAGAVFPSINKAQIENIPIPLPPLVEQQRIVAMLDEVFAAIAKARENTELNLRNARELFESYLDSVFANPGEGWEENRIDQLCVIKGGGTPSKKVAAYWQGQIPWVSPKDMKTRVIMDSQDHITDDAIKYSSTSLIPPGSILIVVRSGILSHTIPIAITNQVLTINQDIKALIPKSGLLTEFLYYQLISKESKILSTINRGATVHRLQSEFLNNIRILIPSIQIQRTITSKLNTVNTETKKLEAIYQQKLGALDELKKSLLQKAFNGEL